MIALIRTLFENYLSDTSKKQRMTISQSEFDIITYHRLDMLLLDANIDILAPNIRELLKIKQEKICKINSKYWNCTAPNCADSTKTAKKVE